MNKATHWHATFTTFKFILAYHYAKSDKKLELAEQLINTALQKRQNNPHFLDTQALILYKQHKYNDALALLNTIIQQEPDDFAILNTLGRTYFKVGKVKEAKDTIERAIKVASNDHEKEQCSALLKRWNTLTYE